MGCALGITSHLKNEAEIGNCILFYYRFYQQNLEQNKELGLHSVSGIFYLDTIWQSNGAVLQLNNSNIGTLPIFYTMKRKRQVHLILTFTKSTRHSDFKIHIRQGTRFKKSPLDLLIRGSYNLTLGSGINVPAFLLFSRHFSRGHGPYSRPKTWIFSEKVHFLDEIRAICKKIALSF